MTLAEIDVLIDDTRRLPRAADKVAHAAAIGILEVARQLIILNEALAAGTPKKTKSAKAAGK